MSMLSTVPPSLVTVFRWPSIVGCTWRSSMSESMITMTSYLRIRNSTSSGLSRPRDVPVAGGRNARPTIEAGQRATLLQLAGRGEIVIGGAHGQHDLRGL